MPVADFLRCQRSRRKHRGAAELNGEFSNERAALGLALLSSRGARIRNGGWRLLRPEPRRAGLESGRGVPRQRIGQRINCERGSKENRPHYASTSSSFVFLRLTRSGHNSVSFTICGFPLTVV